ncbi:MAG: GlsB/YeaQ/YmgE family stress response membrane protein [Hyphomicrobiales bacterium]|nr:GlsB/YeaQ/YmgE family stress response membrane protein [Hyphomicrobiales bacterium]MBV8439773.1 GlsB/YeaQ/YmgE family stress response membrane protein [Hyphomicrobiales bacterium]
MHLSDQGLIVILVIGLIAGWLAGRVVRGNGFGLVGDAAIGIVGALVGDWLLHRLGIHFSSGIFGLIINATIGATVLLVALRLTGASGWGGR